MRIRRTARLSARAETSTAYAAARLGGLVVALMALVTMLAGACSVASGQGDVDVRIGSAEPFTWDPARAGDAGTASVHAQVYEGLTPFDSDSNVQPALAELVAGRRTASSITFQLRPA